MQLRPATLLDADFLREVRNDPLTRANSLHGDIIPAAEHLAYLQSHLEDPRFRILIAEVDGAAMGTCRSDDHGDVIELSWSLAAGARGKGYGTQMLDALLATLPSATVLAVIREGNTASRRMVERAGFRLHGMTGGICHYLRD